MIRPKFSTYYIGKDGRINIAPLAAIVTLPIVTCTARKALSIINTAADFATLQVKAVRLTQGK